MRESGLFTTAVPYNPEKANDFLSLLEAIQSRRLNDQRAELPMPADIHVSQPIPTSFSIESMYVQSKCFYMMILLFLRN
ncbi:hypothetical protein WR25_09418 [Diploscapter pachys]|uniref:Uncharacterized protein n=1 Tax=Diploscapter pachys TaxID=2018661 RepID=A0A2A2KZZ7_9BILA|nr:hypothetical protein WR25_09418 [Diploscapter pachys]